MPTTFAKTIDGNDIYAKRAECDAAGNDLSTTYATKQEIPGSSQLVPSATSADADKVLTVDSMGVPGWAVIPQQPTGLFQATYGTSTYNEVRDAVAANKIVYCSVSGRMAFLAYIASNNYEFQYYRSNSSSLGADSVFVYKVYSSGWETTERTVKAGNISYPVTQVNVNGSSAMTGTVANITIPAAPTVDQTFDATSANAQSGVAIAGALATKQDTISDLATIRSGAAAGATAVQPGDLATVATTGDYSDLTGTPSIPTATSDLTNDSGFITLSDVPAQVQTDWDATSGLGEILHKPDLSIYAESADLSTVATTGSYDDLLDKPAIPAAQVNSDWNASSGVAEILNKPTLATVATSGSYNDLSNKPDLSVYAESADLATVATTGAYSDLTGTPTIPTATSDLTNDSGFITSADLPTVDQTYDATSANAQSGTAVAGAVATKQDVISDLATIRSGAQAGSTAVQPGDLATVATTGAYSDLTGTPTIPTETSDLTNDSGFITLADVPAQVNADWNAASGAAEILNKPSIPSATSDLTNDSGFITLSDVPAQVNADWNSSSGASEILNKPTIPSGAQLVPAATSADADKVLTVDAQGTPAWASAQAPISAGNGIDITNNVVSVDTSVVATQTDLAGKEDAFDVGTGLEMDTSGATPTLQVEAPVDIVAGPGIVIDNPDGNTLRVSQSYPTDETVLWENNRAWIGTDTSLGTNSGTLSETLSNFERIRVYFARKNDGTLPSDNIAELESTQIANFGGIYFSGSCIQSGSSNWFFCHTFLSVSGLTFTETLGGQWSQANGTINKTQIFLHPYKIVGIHRIANN